MIVCTTKTIEITRCKKRKVQANFNGVSVSKNVLQNLVFIGSKVTDTP